MPIARRDLVLGITVALLSISLSVGLMGAGWVYQRSLGTDPTESPQVAVLQQEILTPEPPVPRVQVSDQDPSEEWTQIPGPLKASLVTFVTVFVAEMGDKTQLATMLMSAQSQSPWSIFFGSASALVAASLISVVVGGSLGRLIPPEILQLMAGVGFVGIGLYVLWDVLNEDPEELSEVTKGEL